MIFCKAIEKLHLKTKIFRTNPLVWNLKVTAFYKWLVSAVWGKTEKCLSKEDIFELNFFSNRFAKNGTRVETHVIWP